MQPGALNPPVRVVVFAARPGDRYRSGRTLRALRRRGFDPIDACGQPPEELAALASAGPVWLVRAGGWPPAEVAFPPPSATGRPLCALGAVRPAPDDGERDDAHRWSLVLARTGGDLSSVRGELPPLASVYCGAPAAARLAARLAMGSPPADALAALAASPDLRLVRFSPLDVCDDERLRVLLAVTSLQQGGAERVVLDLFHELTGAGIRSRIVTLGRPTRAAFPAPSGTIDVSAREDRIAALAEAAASDAADLVHAHLLTGDEVERLGRAGVPIAITVHNTRPGWPEGLGDLGAQPASLLVACSLAVEADLRAAGLPIASRTIWNGIDLDRVRPSPTRDQAGKALRRKLGLAEADLVLLSIANPRPQKRLHLLPSVLASARAELFRRRIDRQVRLVLVGDKGDDAPLPSPAKLAAEALRLEIARLDMELHVRFAGSMGDVAPALAAADALVSVSGHEGLSLAHLEALAAGLPVIALDAGGTQELANENPAIAVLPSDAPPGRVAEVAVALALSRPGGGAAAIEASFSRARMAHRHAELYRRTIEAARGPRAGRGLLLVTNNFSTGGAQSSARRLLVGLAAAGARVSAAVLEEQPDYPTPGRRALGDANIPVLALPEAGSIDAAHAIGLLLERIDADPPAAVILWNALAEYKVLLADALLDIPVFDVSPGEMYFASLSRYFQRPRPGLPYRDARAYGARLAGVIVKFEAEAARASAVLGAPVHVIPNGVELGASRAPRREETGSDRLVIGTAARIAPQKRLPDLFAALRIAKADLPPHELRIAGGPERGSDGYAEELRRLAEGLELDVEWLGEVNDAASLLGAVDVFAMISEPAGCPNASLEAMAAGLPVIATDVGGASEQVEDGVTGRLVPRGDARAFASALVELGRDPDKRRAFGAAGRSRAEARFDVRRMVADYQAVCLGDRRRPPR